MHQGLSYPSELLGRPTPPHEAEELRTLSRTTFRGKCWKVLLGGCDITCEEYVELVGRGPSTMHSK